MASLGFEDWLLGAASAVAVVGTFGLHALSSSIAVPANAAESERAAYTITVTAKRLPSHCKVDPSAAGCTAQTTETMRAN